MAQSNLFSPQTQWGASLAGLLDSLYSPAAGVKREKAVAKAERDRAEAEYRRAQAADFTAKRDAEAQARKEKASFIAEALGALQGGGAALGQQTLDYRNRVPVAPQAETSEMPGVIGGYATPRPETYTPAMEADINQRLAGNYFSQLLPGKTNYQQLMGGVGKAKEQSMIEAALNDPALRDRVAGAVRAGRGEPMYQDQQGRILDLTGGMSDETGPQAVANVAGTNQQAAERAAHAALYGAQKSAVVPALPQQTITGPGGVTFPVSGADISRNLTAQLFKPQGANAEMPKLKPGERWNAQLGEVEVVPGSAEYQRRAGLHAKDQQSILTVETKTNEAKRVVDEILAPENAESFKSNFGGYNARFGTQYFPGAQDLRLKIDGLKAQMKSAGLELVRAGGSVGQITQQEWPIVEGMIARIDPLMGEQAARAELMKVAAYLDRIRDNARKVYDTEWGRTQFNPARAATAPPIPQDGGGNKVYRFDAQGNPI